MFVKMLAEVFVEMLNLGGGFTRFTPGVGFRFSAHPPWGVVFGTFSGDAAGSGFRLFSGSPGGGRVFKVLGAIALGVGF